MPSKRIAPMHIVILGNGVAGATAARFVRKLSDYDITMISAETDHFFSRTALMYIYMGHMRYQETKPYEDWFWDKNRINLKRAYVEEIDFDAKTLQLQTGEEVAYDKLLLAVGSEPNKFGWPGQDLEGVRGLYSFQDLQYMETYSAGLERAVIVGGGLIGIEMAEMFHSRHIPITFLVRENSFWDMVLPPEESEMVNRQIRQNGIDLRLNTELQEIVDDGNGRVCAVITKDGERIECGYVGLTPGVHPNIAFLKDTDLETERGILTDEYLRTNLADVYAAGDCAQLRNPSAGRRPIEAVWYVGRIMGETVAYNMCDQPVAYHPGIWFNSAKFMDLEYQVYGTVMPDPPDEHTSLYWEHAEGNRSVRLVYHRDTGVILGFNLMGVRYRHEVCDRWIEQGASIETVLQNLKLANFDPELFREYEADILQHYEQQTGISLSIKKERSWKEVFSFLHR